MEKRIHDSLAAGINHPSSSPVGADFFFLAKKDHTLCPCIDYCGLIAMIVKNKYPLPLISSAFEPIQEATIFSKLVPSGTGVPSCQDLEISNIW